LTGFDDPEDVEGPDGFDGPEGLAEPDWPPLLSFTGGLFGVTGFFGLRRLGLVVVPEF
jgi:hypothetical protein